jgi:hypothetical protein
MIRKKPGPDSVRGGNRFPERIILRLLLSQAGSAWSRSNNRGGRESELYGRVRKHGRTKTVRRPGSAPAARNAINAVERAAEIDAATVTPVTGRPLQKIHNLQQRNGSRTNRGTQL